MPATNPATKNSLPFRGAVLTIFKIEGYTSLPDKLSYFAYGKETCPTTSREHLQAFAYSIRAMRLTGWKKVFPTAHIEPMRGTFIQNENYCSKQGQLTEFGERPMENGHRRSDLIVKDMIDKDPRKPIMEIYDETEERCALIYSRSFEQYREYKRAKSIKGDHSAPEVYYIYGPSGTGKTQYVRDKEPDLYDVPKGYQWFNGYSGEDAVLFDNIETVEKDRAGFLKLIDRYPIQVPTKGGFTWWKPKRIYITTVVHPGDMAKNFLEVKEFYRRITVFKRWPESSNTSDGVQSEAQV